MAHLVGCRAGPGSHAVPLVAQLHCARRDPCCRKLALPQEPFPCAAPRPVHLAWVQRREMRKMMLLALPRGALVPIRESRLHTNTAWHLPVGIVSAGVDPAAPRAVAAAAAGTRLGRTRAAGEEVKRRRGCDRAGLGRLHRVSGTSWQARAAAITPCAGRRRLSSFSIRVQALSLPLASTLPAGAV